MRLDDGSTHNCQTVLNSYTIGRSFVTITVTSTGGTWLDIENSAKSFIIRHMSRRFIRAV